MTMFEREMKFYMRLQLAKRMLESGVLTEKEFLKVKKDLIEKYHPFLTNS